VTDHVSRGSTTGRTDAVGDRLERLRGAAGQVHSRALAGKGARDGGPDPAGAAVDDGVAVFEQH